MRFYIFRLKTFGEFVIFFMFHDAILVVRDVEGRDYSKAHRAASYCCFWMGGVQLVYLIHTLIHAEENQCAGYNPNLKFSNVPYATFYFSAHF